MAYTFSPFGFQQVGNYTQATSNSQLGSPAYRIQSGYIYPIYPGDPVTVYVPAVAYSGTTYTFTYTTDGYIHSLAEWAIEAAKARTTVANTIPSVSDMNAVGSCVPILGHFAGCNYGQDSISNPYAGPYEQYWTAAQVTNGALDAFADVYDDPHCMLEVQTDVTGIGADGLFYTYAPAFSWVTDAARTVLAAPYVASAGQIDPARAPRGPIINNPAYPKSGAYLLTSTFTQAIYPIGLTVTAAASPTLTTIGTQAANGAGYLAKCISPVSTPQQLTVNGTLAAAEPFNRVYVTLQSAVLGRVAPTNTYTA